MQFCRYFVTSLTSLAAAITSMRHYDGPVGHDGGLAVCAYIKSNHTVDAYIYSWADTDAGTHDGTSIVQPLSLPTLGRWLAMTDCCTQ